MPSLPGKRAAVYPVGVEGKDVCRGVGADLSVTPQLHSIWTLVWGFLCVLTLTRPRFTSAASWELLLLPGRWRNRLSKGTALTKVTHLELGADLETGYPGSRGFSPYCSLAAHIWGVSGSEIPFTLSGRGAPAPCLSEPSSGPTIALLLATAHTAQSCRASSLPGDFISNISFDPSGHTGKRRLLSPLYK